MYLVSTYRETPRRRSHSAVIARGHVAMMSLVEPAPPAGFVWADAPVATPPAAPPATVSQVAVDKLVVHTDADAVSAAIVQIVEAAAAKYAALEQDDEQWAAPGAIELQAS